VAPEDVVYQPDAVTRTNEYCKEQGIDYGQLNEKLEQHDYPMSTDTLIEEYGEYEIDHQYGTKTLQEVFDPLTESNDQTFDSADQVRQMILNMRDLIAERSTVQTLFNTLLSGAILLVSIVVSINSVVFSQEITDIENQRDRIDATMNYRKRIEQLIDAYITPARPSEFLHVVLHTVFRETQALRRVAADNQNDEFQANVETFADHTIDEIEQARSTLNKTRFGTFKVLLTGLNYDYSGQLHAARGFKRKYGDTLSNDEQASIDSLIDTLKFFATGREYFKSLYYKRELAPLQSLLEEGGLAPSIFANVRSQAPRQCIWSDYIIFHILMLP
jgi:hypothetical protein